MSAEAQLVGAILHAHNATEVVTICQVVPIDAIDDTLNRKIVEACRYLADRDQWDVKMVARTVILEGRWPQQLHGEVTARVVDLLEGCRWPTVWRDSAAAVIDAHARRRITSVLVNVTSALDERPLADVTAALHDAVALASTSSEIVTALHGGDAA